MPPSTPIRSIMLATTALMMLPGIVEAVTYDLVMSDQSPMLAWDPSQKSINKTAIANGDTGPDKMWAVTYSQSTWDPASDTNIGQGSSAHRSSVVGAAHVYLDFVGSGVGFLGTFEGGEGASGVTLDADSQQGTGPSSSDWPVLDQVQNLNFGSHRAQMTISRGSVSVTGVTIRTEFESEAKTFASVNTTEVLAAAGNNVNAAQFATTGGPWRVERGAICTDDANAGAVTFTVPADTSFVEIWGRSSPQQSRYEVAVSPTPQGSPANDFAGNAFNPWTTSENIMYFAVLDPTKAYTITIRNMAQTVCVSKARVYFSKGQSVNTVPSGPTSTIGPNSSGSPTNAAGASASASSGSNVVDGTGDGSVSGDGSGSSADNNGMGGKKSKAGAIAGGVVGGLAAIAAIVALLFFLRRRKRNQRKRQRAMYKATSRSPRDRPGSWAPFLAGAGTLGGATLVGKGDSHKDRDMEMTPPPPVRTSSDGDGMTSSQSRHTSLQTFDSTPVTPPVVHADPPIGVAEFGTPILANNEMSKFTPSRGDMPYSSMAHGGSHSSIPSQSSLPPISEMPRTIPPQHSFAAFAGAGAATTTGHNRARSALSSPSTDTVDSQQLPPGWPSPPTSPPRAGPRPPPRKHARPGSMSPPASPNPPPVGTMPLFGKPGTLFD